MARSEDADAHEEVHSHQTQRETQAAIDETLQQPVGALLLPQQLAQLARQIVGRTLQKLVHQTRQTRQQLGVQTLSLANQGPQVLLSLFR